MDLLLLGLGLIASLANVLGGWVVTARMRVGRQALNILVALGAGFMLAAAIVEVIPRSLEINEGSALIILLGYLFVHLVEHTIATHFHFGEETHPEQVLGARAAYSALSGLVLHSFFDGALISAGFWISKSIGVLMFLAIFLHKIPEGFTAASIMRASGRGANEQRLATAAISISTLAGVVSINALPALVRWALPFSSGVTLYVAASDLIPEVNKESRSAVSVGVFLGVGLFFVSEALLNLALPG